VIKVNNINIMAEKANELKAQGNTAFQSGKFEEAVNLFTQAIELNPNDHVFYSNRSGAYASLKNYENALNDANKCIEINPKWGKGYQRKGLAEYYLNKIPDAVETYKKGLEM
jgi:stress-induced-phosphoprotein 1